MKFVRKPADVIAGLIGAAARSPTGTACPAMRRFRLQYDADRLPVPDQLGSRKFVRDDCAHRVALGLGKTVRLELEY